MRKRLDDLFSALMLAAAVAVVLVGWHCLARSIARAGDAMPAHPPLATVYLQLPAPESAQVSTPEPTAEIPVYIYDPAIPLSQELQETLCEACAEAGVPMALALGVIQVESCFYPEADNGQCYGLMQLNRDYFPDKLSPGDNLRAGIEYLGRLLGEYKDPAAALTAYHAGHDTGSRMYANAVLEAAEWWGAK